MKANASEKKAHIWIKRIFLMVCAYACIFSLGKVLRLQGDVYNFHVGNYFEYNVISVLVFGITIWLLNRFWARVSRRLFFYSAFGGLLLSAAIVYGTYAHFVNDIFRSAGECFFQVGLILGISVLTVPVVSEIYLLGEKINVWVSKNVGQEKDTAKNAAVRYIYGHPAVYFVCVWMIIFVSYIPLFLAWWPGNFIFDSKYQLRDAIQGTYSTHHPILHTLMLGNAYKLGQRAGNVSWGCQFYTLIQMLILTSSFAYLLLYLYKKQTPKGIRVGTILWFALFPMHALFSITATKDVLCAAFFLYFMIYVVRLVYDNEQFRWYSYLGMVVSGVLLMLFRNNAPYAVVLASVFMAVLMKGWKNKGKVLILCMAIYALARVSNEGLIVYTNATSPTTYRETLCVPLQCMARVASYRREDMPQDLYDEVCVYIRERDLSGYNPYLADAVKDNANELWLKNNTLNFFKLWGKIGLKFPGEYLESIITNTMAYWYPLNHGIYLSLDVPLIHQLIGVEDEIVKYNYCPWAYGIYEDLFWAGNYIYIPLLGFFFRNVTYVWLIVFYIFWCLYKKDRKGIMAGMLPVFYLLTCLCAPTAALRYIYCLVVCAPLLIYIIVSHRKNHQG